MVRRTHCNVRVEKRFSDLVSKDRDRANLNSTLKLILMEPCALIVNIWLSTLVHKFGNVFRYAARGRETGVASSFFSRSMRSARVKCQAKGWAMLW